LVLLHNIFIEILYSHLTSKDTFTTPLSKGFCLALYWDETPPSGKHCCSGKEGAQLAPSAYQMTGTLAPPSLTGTGIEIQPVCSETGRRVGRCQKEKVLHACSS